MASFRVNWVTWMWCWGIGVRISEAHVLSIFLAQFKGAGGQAGSSTMGLILVHEATPPLLALLGVTATDQKENDEPCLLFHHHVGVSPTPV